MHVPARECLPLPVYAGLVAVTAGNSDAVDYGVAEPVWKQLTGILRARIRSGRYEPRRAIPSEKQLEQEFGVARGTARKAIAALRSDGLVVTVAGRGSYVADPLPDEDEP
jgi:DNA-binding GntR family transcriptional regulator